MLIRRGFIPVPLVRRSDDSRDGITVFEAGSDDDGLDGLADLRRGYAVVELVEAIDAIDNAGPMAANSSRLDFLGIGSATPANGTSSTADGKLFVDGLDGS